VVILQVSTTAATEEYDGSTWTTSPTSLNQQQEKFSRSRNTSISISFWWYTTSITAATEEFTITGTKHKNNNGKLIWQNI
jgi:hypothetical protein